jgi:hypothetical protein
MANSAQQNQQEAEDNMSQFKKLCRFDDRSLLGVKAEGDFTWSKHAHTDGNAVVEGGMKEFASKECGLLVRLHKHVVFQARWEPKHMFESQDEYQSWLSFKHQSLECAEREERSEWAVAEQGRECDREMVNVEGNDDHDLPLDEHELYASDISIHFMA